MVFSSLRHNETLRFGRIRFGVFELFRRGVRWTLGNGMNIWF